MRPASRNLHLHTIHPYGFPITFELENGGGGESLEPDPPGELVRATTSQRRAAGLIEALYVGVPVLIVIAVSAYLALTQS